MGRVAEVWCGDDPKEGGEWDQAVCSRIEVHPAAANLLQRLARRRRPAGPALFVPCDAITGVSGKRVELSVGAKLATERWTGEPMWIRKARAGLGPAASAGHGEYDHEEVSLWGGGEGSMGSGGI